MDLTIFGLKNDRDLKFEKTSVLFELGLAVSAIRKFTIGRRSKQKGYRKT